MTGPDLATLGIDAGDAEQLRRAVHAGVPGNLVIIAAPDPAMAFEAARSCAAWMLPANPGPDLRLAIPTTDRWSIDEVNERILGPARLRAFERTHVVVADADQMSPSAHDHVLKTVEEPTSGALFWFAVSNLDALPVTLRGRAGLTVAIRPAAADQQVDLLVQAGADPQRAAELASLAGDDIRLALAVARHPELLEPLRLYRTGELGTPTPTAHGDRILGAVMALAAAMPTAEPAGATATSADQPPQRRSRARTATKAPSKSGIRPRWDTLTPPARAEARRLVRRLLERWATQLVDGIVEAETATDLRRTESALQALHAARLELATNAPAATALPALLARVSQ